MSQMLRQAVVCRENSSDRRKQEHILILMDKKTWGLKYTPARNSAVAFQTAQRMKESDLWERILAKSILLVPPCMKSFSKFAIIICQLTII